MCEKQCRDENGFKCHCLSESHQRQMQVFGQNPNRIVGGYSEEFESSFVDHMRRSHRSRVAATVVYNEYIADRHHIHMNSTQWSTLTEFVKYLGRKGTCKVEETSKGWFMTYIDRESEAMQREKMLNKRFKSDLVEEERRERTIAKQIERAMEHVVADENPAEVKAEFVPGEKKVTFSMASSSSVAPKRPIFTEKSELGFEDGVEKEANGIKKVKSDSRGGILGEMMKEEEKAKERSNRRDYWICEGIVVKIMSKDLAEKGYYKQKGVVVKVIDKYVAEIKMLENKHVLRVDQKELETVIPQIGGLVRIVNGAYRGSNARMLAVNKERYCVKVQIEKGIYDGRLLSSLDYEDICKIA